MSQTSYSVEAARAFAGMLAEFDNILRSSITRANENASAIAFGKPAVAGTDAETQFDLPSGAGDLFLGITVHRHGTEDPTDDGIANGEPCELLRRGRIWVIAEPVVAVGDAVYWRHTTTPGAWRNDATDSVLLPTAVWATATAAVNSLAVIDINMP
jgi:hypothetical protein